MTRSAGVSPADQAASSSPHGAGTAPDQPPGRWRSALLFVALVLLHIAPIWSVHYFPTGDGPTHAYNAWVMHGLVTGTAPANVEQAYSIVWRPMPNWTSLAVMAALNAVVAPLVAEKIVVSVILALFLAGAWVLTTTVDPRNGIYAFLAIPFAYAYTLVGGFYNFTLGVALYLFIVAWWWRHRQRETGRSIAGLAALLLVCALTHAVATAAACGAMLLLSVLLRRYRQLLAMLPAVILLALHSPGESTMQGAIYWPIRWDTARILAKAQMIPSFHGWQIWIATAIAVIFALLAIYTLARDRRRPALALMVVALAMIAVMFWCPAPRSARDHLTERLSLFVFLTLAASFTPLERTLRRAFLAVAVLLALFNVTLVYQGVIRLGRDTNRFVRSFDAIEAGTSALPLFYAHPVSPSYVNVLVHAFSHVALEKRLADPVNFAPEVGHFPIARRDRAFPVSQAVHIPQDLDIAKHAVPRFAYIATRGMPNDAPNRSELEHRYVLVAENDELRIYRRSRLSPRNEELILLPLLGTHAPQGAPAGMSWRVDQQLRNRGPRPMELRFRRCLEELPCAFVLAPNETRAIATPSTGFAYLAAAKEEAEQLEVSTVVRRADVERPDLSITTPAARESAFKGGGTRLANLGTADKQVGLRVYVLSAGKANIVVRLRASGAKAVIASRTFEVEKDGMFSTADLYSAFGNAYRSVPAIDVEILSPNDVRCWAFATVRDKEGRTTVTLPGAWQ